MPLGTEPAAPPPTTPAATTTTSPATPPATPPAEPSGSPAPATPPAEQTVPIPLSQLQAFTQIQARLAEIEAQQRASQEASQREVQNALLAKGQAEDALRLSREQADAALRAEQEKLTAMQRQVNNHVLDTAILRALAPFSFVNDKARGLVEAELRAELQVQPEGGGFAVRDATYRTPDQVVAAKLSHADYQPFLKANNPTVATTTGQPAQVPPQPGAPPTTATAPAGTAPGSFWDPKSPNLGQSMVNWAEQQRANLPHGGDPLLNTGQLWRPGRAG
jgi:hypothetical protein